MVKINNEYWFSAVDIANGLNEQKDDFKDIRKTFNKAFGWSNSHYITFQYMQNVLSKAKINNEIRYCTYYRKAQGRPLYVYTLPDLLKWVQLQEQKQITKYTIYEVKK